MRRFIASVTCLGLAIAACTGETIPLGEEDELRKNKDAGSAADVTGADGGSVASDAHATADVGADDGGSAVETGATDGGMAIDAGGPFVCGGAICSSLEYCSTFISGIPLPDGGTSKTTGCATFDSLSGACAAKPTCACAMANCTGVSSGCSCTDDGDGHLNVTYYGI
jgi:hypothetical protein